MKKNNTSHWIDLPRLQGLLFFSQSVDEMLWDYTLDSYKPSALNCRLLCHECLTQIEEVRAGFIQKNSLNCIAEELRWSLGEDLAAKSILGAKKDFYISKIKTPVGNLEELETITSYLLKQFSDKKYLEKIKQLLTTQILDGKNKFNIRALTNSFLTELINYGYHPEDIDYQNFNFFFSQSKRSQIKEPTEINEFFDLFSFEKKHFTVVFIGGNIFNEFRGTLNKFDTVVTKNYNCFSKIAADIEFKQSIKTDETFIICSKIEAYDHHSAREVAESFLGKVTGIFNFFHHKRRAQILEKAVVSRIHDNYVIVLEKTTKSILKIKSDLLPKEAAEEVSKTISDLRLNASSTHRFSRSIDLHSAALSASEIQNQLLDLWAALETLLPKSFEENNTRIEQICKSLVPFLQLNYFHKLLLELLSDLKFWNETKTNEVLSKIPESSDYSDLEKIAAFVSLESCVSFRSEIYALLDDFPLLKNRIFTLHELVQSPKNIKRALDFHRIKSEWHIRRIYRTRGQIIHSGKFPSFTTILIENLHAYLDIFLKKLIELAIENKINTIEQGVMEMQLMLEYQNSLLIKHQGEALSKDNFKEALLGFTN